MNPMHPDFFPPHEISLASDCPVCGVAPNIPCTGFVAEATQHMGRGQKWTRNARAAVILQSVAESLFGWATQRQSEGGGET